MAKMRKKHMLIIKPLQSLLLQKRNAIKNLNKNKSPKQIQDARETHEALLQLPLDQFLNVISRLDIQSLAVSRCVCNTWNKIVCHPHFIRMHHRIALQRQENNTLLFHVRSSDDSSDIYLLEPDKDDDINHGVVVKPQIISSDSFLVEDFELVGSCNGLICLSDEIYHDPIYVCNPVIGEYIKLPTIGMHINVALLSGFGYDEVTNEYKVMRMWYDAVELRSDDIHCVYILEAETYTLGFHGWRNLGKVKIPYPICRKSAQVFVNGAIHWQMDQDLAIDVSNLIIAFDVSTEEFRDIPHPHEVKRSCLGNFGGCLCLLDHMCNDHCVIWVMKQYGVEGSWNKECVISRKVLGFEKVDFTLVKLMKDGKILLVVNRQSLVSYDPSKQSFHKFGIHKIPPSLFNAIPHVASFLSIKDIVGRTSRKSHPNARRWYSSTSMYPI